MIVACPNCKVRLRSNRASYMATMRVTCPACQFRFKVSPRKPLFKALVAHEDLQVRQQLKERIAPLGGLLDCCDSAAAVHAALLPAEPCALLLDVAFCGSFPFQLIEQITTAGNAMHKVILLPSVFNRTAYKKRPDSLYGADAYLELHHIGDRLVPLLVELFPALAQPLEAAQPFVVSGTERALPPADVIGQANSLAKLLVADILLYHQPQLEEGIRTGQLQQLFAEQLAEGRHLLAQRLPEAADLPADFIQRAFDAACQSYSCN